MRATFCCPHQGGINDPLNPKVGNLSTEVILRSEAACCRIPSGCCCIGGCHTSRAAMRPVTAPVVKKSASLDCGSASFRLQQCCRFHRAQVESPGMIHLTRTDQSPLQALLPSPFCTLVMQSCGVRTLPEYAPSGRATCGRHACDTDPESLSTATLLWSAECFFSRRCRVLSDSRESCASSCGALRRLFRCGQARVRRRHQLPGRRSHSIQSISDTFGFITVGFLDLFAAMTEVTFAQLHQIFWRLLFLEELRNHAI